MRCAACSGTGETTDGMCSSCLGTGLVGLSRPQNAINTDLAARLAKAERERDDIATEIAILRGQFNAQQRHDGALIASLSTKVEDLTRALEEAERVIKPFADVARKISDETGVPEYALSDNRSVSITLGECRAARKWMEERHD